MEAGISVATLAALLEMKLEDFRNIAWSSEFGVISVRRRYSLSEALTLEIARQLSELGGLPLSTAFTMILSTLGNPKPERLHDNEGDVWIGVMGSRIVSGDERGKIAEAHFAGPLAKVSAKIATWIEHDQALYPNAYPARIFLTNVSTADRLLRRRAADLGINIRDNEFVAD